MAVADIWQEWNGFIRMQKHWMLNQFQIVMGYIQIGKPELAFDYIKRTTSMVQDTSAFSKMQDAEFGVRMCLIWWDMCEGGIMLSPTIDDRMTVPNKENFFEDFALFMDDLKVRYLLSLGERTIKWEIVSNETALVSSLRCTDDSKLPNLYAEKMPFQGNIKVEGASITYSFNFK